MDHRTGKKNGKQNIVKKFEKLEEQFLSEIKASRYKSTPGQLDPIDENQDASRSKRAHVPPDTNRKELKGEILPENTAWTTKDAQKHFSVDQVLGSAKNLTHHLRENDAISENNLRDLEEKVIQLEKALQERLRLQVLRKEKIGLLESHTLDERQNVSEPGTTVSAPTEPTKNIKPTTKCTKCMCNLKSKKNVDVIYKNEATGKTFVIKCQPYSSEDGRSKDPRLKIRVYRVVNNDGLIRIRLLKNGKRIIITPKCQQQSGTTV